MKNIFVKLKKKEDAGLRVAFNIAFPDGYPPELQTKVFRAFGEFLAVIFTPEEAEE